MILLQKASDNLNRVFEVVCIVLFTIVILASSLQVFTRYILNASLSWTEELARFSFVWLSLLGAGIAAKRGTHAVVTVVLDLIKGRPQFTLKIVINLLVIFGAAVLVNGGLKVVAVTINQESPAIGIPMGLVYAAVPVCGLSIILHSLADLAALIKCSKG